MVHGIGNQRPLDTVRGLVDAVWRGEDDKKDGKKTWVHPEASGIDLDLSVFTTNAVPQVGNRTVDFHELYWAHLMSETRAIAVVLWLFELVRKGPRLNPRMTLLWWGGAIFLCALILSVSLLAVLGIVRFSNAEDQPQDLLYAAVLIGLIGLGGTIVYSWIKGALQYVKLMWFPTVGTAAFLGACYFLVPVGWQAWFANQLLPITVAGFAILIVMGIWGLRAYGYTLLLSFVFFGIYLAAAYGPYLIGLTATPLRFEGLPWNLLSPWSAIAAWLIIGLYLAANAAFLQSYLGDAARYFRNSPANVAGRREIRRQAVNTLAALHTSGLYDRIVVVAHSLGTVVAYDMLRAYYARICRQIPITTDADALYRLNAADSRIGGSAPEQRALGRAVIRDLARAVPGREPSNANPWTQPKAWLVTDFVTLGSALVHARYLMCRGNTSEQLDVDFQPRKEERELPLCPPYPLYDDGLLTFTPTDVAGAHRRFHHGGMFALTRWTNLYFEMWEILWGDPVGGPLAEIFGKNIADIKVYTKDENIYDWLAHTKYWDIECEKKRQAPHIVALREAISLDRDDAIVALAAETKVKEETASDV
jgi:hypothetical protein